jgi:cellulose biosynthesis protein BcsQ
MADGDRQGSLAALGERADSLPAVRAVYPMQFPALARESGLTLLDLPSGIGVEFHAALEVADVAIVPAVPSAFDLRTLPATLGELRKAQERRAGLPRVLLVPNKIDLRETISKELLEVLGELGWPVTRRWLNARSSYRRMGSAGLSALPSGARRAASAEVTALADEVLEFLVLPSQQEAA